MHTVIVVTNPRNDSFSKALVEQVSKGIVDSGNTVEIADLAGEDFDPRMREADIAYTFGRGTAPNDVRREQKRIDRADALFVIYPLYWWHMPGLLKGWIDRVFQNGWAFGYNEEGALIPLLRDRPVHVLVHCDTDDANLDKRSYRSAIHALIDGIFGFCGIRDLKVTIMSEVSSERASIREAHLSKAYKTGLTIFADETLVACK